MAQYPAGRDRYGDATLNVGTTTQQVVVSSDVQAMHTENPEVANTFNTSALESLPNVTPNGRTS